MRRLLLHATCLLFCMTCVGPLAATAQDQLDALRQDVDRLQQAGQHAEALAAVEQLAVLVAARFGEASGEYAAILARQGGLEQVLGKYQPAETSFKKALAIATAALGPEHAGVTFILNDLGFLYRVRGRFAEAEDHYRRALQIREKALGPEHPAVGHIVSNLGALHVTQGKYAQAEPLLVRAVAISEKALKADHPEVGKNLNNLATLYWSVGRFGEAEPLFKRALGIVEIAYGPDHPAVSSSLNNLALLYQDQGRYADAEPLFQRALAIREKAHGPEHAEVGLAANNLAWLYQAQARYAAAEPLYRRALDITERALGPAHADVGSMLNNLAVLYHHQGRYKEAEPLFKRAIEVRRRALGAEHSDVGQTMYRLARLYHAQKRFAEARPLHQRALEIRRKAQGPEHPEVIQSLDGIAQMYEAQGNWKPAADAARQAGQIITQRARKGTLAADGAASETGRREIGQGRETFARLVRSLWALSEQEPKRRQQFARESYLAAHWAEQSEASAALAQMSLRQAKGDGPLASLIRERQDLARQWQALDKQLYASVAQGTGRNAQAERQLREQLSDIDSRRRTIDQTLGHEFADYFALSNPEPVSLNETAQLLKADEALIQFLVTDTDVFVWAITKSTQRWLRSSLDAKALTTRVIALRCGLDDTAWPEQECQRLFSKTAANRNLAVSGLPFDAGRAYELYDALLRPLEDVLKGKRLLVVTSGPLSRLPLHVLLTKRPDVAIPSNPADYRTMAWLGQRHSIAVLPSVSALKGLRQQAKATPPRQPYLGIGNPLLDGPQDDTPSGLQFKRLAAVARTRQSCANVSDAEPVASVRGGRLVRSAARGGSRADVSELRLQTPLPETADELCAVARNLGAAESAVLLGDRATEGHLKDLSSSGALADYNILHFATHGTLPGQMLDVTEPGLILTPPSNTDEKSLERDDGFLSASEIATLKLNASWVVLSACNTAGPSQEGSEALSGLARAFFYAGSRSLLASHWEVNSQAAVELTTRAFAKIAAQPSLGRSGALRLAMRELLQKDGPSAHPSYWAPFVVVGEDR
jgi:CHAT domain-containing protein/tetratricopeptide (TPR) repeat protein